MPQPNADRNLLFGILALQMDFITREQLLAAMQAWVFEKKTPLGQILCKQGALADDMRLLLDALVEKHLSQHGNDPEKSLAAIGAGVAVKEELKRIADPDVQASLNHVVAMTIENDDPYMTRAPSVGTPTSSGVRFRILRPYARGGLGEVHVALDEELHREVALKQIQTRHADDRESQARFLLEAEITGGLEHPGIVPVYGVGHYPDGRPYYAMRFIRGDSLKEAIDAFHKADAPGRDPGERSLQLRALLGRFVDVCNAIAYAHSRGVLHRDLKPGNIMLGKYGETLVVDWGLAKPVIGSAHDPKAGGEGTLTLSSGSLASQTLMGSAVGTPQFMSPEQAAGRLDQVGPASDVYSLGSTLYSLLTGRPAIEDPDVGVVLKNVQSGMFPRPREIKPNVPKALEAICLKAMALRVDDRYSSPRLLADDIEHWLADEPVSAWQEPWSIKARRWMGRHRTLASGIASAVLVASVALAVSTGLLAAANQREREARASAQEQRDEALAQRKNAEHNFQLARKAVDRYHTEVSENTLLHEPGMEGLRKRLLEAAREFYQQFVSEHADDRRVRGEYAHALFRLALITGELNSGEVENIKLAAEHESIKLLNQARAIFSDLAGEQPEEVELKSDLATCLHHLGRLYRLTDQINKARKAYEAALTNLDALVSEAPTDRHRADQARSQLGLGNVDEVTSKLEQAKQNYLSALATREKLASAHGKIPEYQRDLAVSHHNLGVVYAALGETEPAEKAYLAALKTQKQLTAEYPHISQYENDLARTHYNLGELHADDRQYQAAEETYKQAEIIWKRLTRLHPDVTEFQTNLAEVYAARATSYRLASLKEKARLADRDALAIRERLVETHQGVPRYQADVARSFVSLADIERAAGDGTEAEIYYSKAATILQKLVNIPSPLPEYQNELARCYNKLGLLFAPCPDLETAKKYFLKARDLWKKLYVDHEGEQEFAVGVSTAAYNIGNLFLKDNPIVAQDWYTQAIDALPSKDIKGERNTGARAALRNAYWKRAEAFTKANQFARAVVDWDRAIDLAGNAQRPWFHLYRALALARNGEHARANGEAFVLEGNAKKSGEALYQLACVYSLCAAAAVADAMLNPEEGHVLVDRYCARAMQFLTQADALGYFKMSANIEKLAKDMDLDALRKREEFQKLWRLIGNNEHE